MRRFLIDYIKGTENRVAYIYERYHDGGKDYMVELQQRGVVIGNAGPFSSRESAMISGRVEATEELLSGLEIVT